MKKQFLTLSIIAALTACSSDDDNNSTDATPADISGDFSATATKAVNPTGRVVVTDVNPGESLIYPFTAKGQFGTFFINAAGEWEYTLDKTNDDIVALVSSDMPTLSEAPFTFQTVDGSTGSISVDIQGIDVPALFSGALTYSVFYDDGTASAKIKVSDANPAEAEFAPNQTPTAMYGTVTFDSDTGEWTYDLDETNADVKALNYTEETDTPPSLDDTFVVTSLDGTEATVTVTIKGSQLIPAVIEGLPVDETGASTAIVNVNLAETSGSLTITDPNFEEAKFQTQDAIATTYGTFSIDEAGAWVYKLDVTNAEVIALKGDGALPTPLTETIKVMAIDGTAVDIPVTINGLVGGNLAAQIGGAEATGQLSIQLGDAPLKTGKITFKANLGTDSLKNVDIILWGVRYHSDKYRSTMVLNPQANGDFKFLSVQTQDAPKVDDSFVLDQKHTPGQWFDVALTWDATNATTGTPVKLTLAIDGNPVSGAKISNTEFDAQTLVTSGIVADGSKFIEFVLGGGASTSFYIDDLVVYSDVAGTTQVLAEDFDSLAEGTPLTITASDATRTAETVVGPIAKP